MQKGFSFYISEGGTYILFVFPYHPLTYSLPGDHCIDKTSMEIFNNMQLDSISCTVDEVPIARILAAQAEIKLSLAMAPAGVTNGKDSDDI